MGYYPTKAADNIYCQCRKEAAKFNDSLNSREGAAEQLNVSVSTLSDYELGITKSVPVEAVVRMADLYNAPELRNYYCTHDCPIGRTDVPPVHLEELDRLVIYVGSGWNDSDGPVDGYRAVCRVCGLISSTPANQSVVHSAIPGAVSLIENLSNTDYEDAIKHGMLAVSMDASDTVQLDSQVTTLVNPGEDDDDGWKHIRRLVTRNESMDRVDRALASLKVNCDTDGIASVIQAAQKVLDTMVGEKKIAAGASFYVDPDKPAKVDSAWFIVDEDDIDSLEKVYLHYRFRFSAAA